MRAERGRKEELAAWIAELGVAFGLVLACFVLFLLVLGLSFPSGTSLRDLMGYSAGPGTRGGSGPKVDLGPAEERPTLLVASLARVFRRVTDRPPDAIAWSDAHEGEALRDRHAVQTFSRSGATIVFGEKHGMQLSENSLIILKRLEREPSTRTERAALLLMEGELSPRVEPGSDRLVEFEVTTGQGQFRVAGSGSKPADFKLTTAANQASTLAVYEGQASVTAQGKTVLVASNHAVTVLPGQAPGLPVRLAARPVASAPRHDALQSYRGDAAEVRFDWAEQPDAEQYRFVLARDPEFGEIVHDGAFSESGFTHGHLRAGTYYWKVSALRGRVEGPATTGRRLVVIQDREPPALHVEEVQGIVEASAMTVRGTTEPGSRVRIGAHDAPIDPTGAFAAEHSLTLGLNLIAVEAQDGAGNLAYHSLLVNAKFSEKMP